MPGRRSANLRGGDLAEGLAAEMMRPFAAVVPVPRTEDVGVDFFATLLHRRGPMLHAGETFAVQTKSASVSELALDEREYNWLCSQRLPLFWLSLDLALARASLHSLHRLILHPHGAHVKTARAYLRSRDATFDSDDDHDHSPTIVDGELRVYVGQPVLTWTVSELADAATCEQRFEVLSAWVDLSLSNLRTRLAGTYAVPSWTTNQAPKSGYRILVGASGFSEALNYAGPLIESIAYELARRMPEHRRSIEGFAQAMKAAGFDVDPLGMIARIQEIEDILANATGK